METVVRIHDLIIKDNFTFEIKDYLLHDLKTYYCRRVNDKKGNNKKQFYFDEICKYIININNYDENMDEKTQMEVRKLLKRLGINSQEQLHKYISENPNSKNIPVKVSFEIDGKEYYVFEDKLEI